MQLNENARASRNVAALLLRSTIAASSGRSFIRFPYAPQPRQKLLTQCAKQRGGRMEVLQKM